jgi:AraC-like DNA-binding protein
MQSSHTFTVDSAVFDERNLVSAAGLVPVLELAEQTGLSELIAEHVQLPSTRVRSGAVNPAGKPWSMPDLSRAIGVSARTLQDGFQRYVGVSPTCYLREVRLQRARGSQQPGVVYDGVRYCLPMGIRASRSLCCGLSQQVRRVALGDTAQVGIERTSITDAVTLAVPGGRFVTVTSWACRFDRMAQRLRGGGRPNTRRRQGIRTPRGSRCR